MSDRLTSSATNSSPRIREVIDRAKALGTLSGFALEAWMTLAYEAGRQSVPSESGVTSDPTPCDRLMRDPLDSNDLRSWRSLAYRLENELRERIRQLNDLKNNAPLDISLKRDEPSASARPDSIGAPSSDASETRFVSVDALGKARTALEDFRSGFLPDGTYYQGLTDALDIIDRVMAEGTTAGVALGTACAGDVRFVPSAAPVATPLNCDRDPARWAREFNDAAAMQRFPYDEGFLIGWFANAMMCGEDTYRWRTQSVAIEQLRETAKFLQQVASRGGPLSGNAMEQARRCLVSADLSVRPAARFTDAHNALNLVDMLLVEAGYARDSSVRHNLAIAKSIFNDAERSLPSASGLISQHDAAIFKAFFDEHAIGSKGLPSCLLCGYAEPDRQRWAVTHAELPDIYICKSCVDKARS